MKKVAVLIDGNFLCLTLERQRKAPPTADDIYQFALRCVKPEEELFRVYYYDSPPFEGKRTNPISRQQVTFDQTKLYRDRHKFLEQLEIKNHIALRSGRLQHKGWSLIDEAFEDLCYASSRKLSPPAMLEGDVKPDFNQKEVDIKIGLDIAWLSSKQIVDKIILVTNDSDFIPAMKFARREATMVVLIDIGNVQNRLKAHADEVRHLTHKPIE